jgi:hypothetical protein
MPSSTLRSAAIVLLLLFGIAFVASYWLVALSLLLVFPFPVLAPIAILLVTWAFARDPYSILRTTPLSRSGRSFDSVRRLMPSNISPDAEALVWRYYGGLSGPVSLAYSVALTAYLGASWATGHDVQFLVCALESALFAGYSLARPKNASYVA